MQIVMKYDNWKCFNFSSHGFINGGSVTERRKRCCKVGLCIEVNKQDLIALAGKNAAKAAGSSGFANASLMVGNSDNS